MTQDSNMTSKYSNNSARVIAFVITQQRNETNRKGFNFAQQLMLKERLKKWGDRGKKVAIEELDQLWKRNTFQPINVKDVKPSKRRKAQSVDQKKRWSDEKPCLLQWQTYKKLDQPRGSC